MSIIYVPFNLDEYQTGFEAALPSAADTTDIIPDLPADADVWTRLAALYGSVADAVAAAHRPGAPTIVVSGDCTVSIGMTAGLQRVGVDPAVVWCDAHGDVQSLETSTSGYLGGMALRFLMGYRTDLVTDRLSIRPLAEERVVLVDARDLDPPEAEFLAASRVRHVTVAELAGMELPPGPILLNLDLDIVDPQELPGLRYPAPDGPGIPAIVQAARTILASGRVVAVNIAGTWYPSHADPEHTRQRLISDLLAEIRRAA